MRDTSFDDAATPRQASDRSQSRETPRDRIVDVLAVVVLGVFVALSANFAMFAASVL